MRVLFIVKKRQDYCSEYSCDYSYADLLGGLYNSALFVVQMLNLQHGIVAKVVLVQDNNDIDREVTKFKPNIVVIEALWVVPAKFPVLSKLHPKVKWIVRIHSEIPFLSLEGMAIGWIKDYIPLKNVYVACNSWRATRDVRAIIREQYGNAAAESKVAYLPNWYPPAARTPDPFTAKGAVHIGCFGAIRPFKNQLIQALAAIEYADRIGDVLHFHINSTRCEQTGLNVLKNLRALFKDSGHFLVEHDWETHDEFVKTISRMDVELGVSYSETFNIVSADAITSKIPIVVSSEVSWAAPRCYADPNSVTSIVEALQRVTSQPVKWWLIRSNLRNLRKYDRASVSIWTDYLKNV